MFNSYQIDFWFFWAISASVFSFFSTQCAEPGREARAGGSVCACTSLATTWEAALFFFRVKISSSVGLFRSENTLFLKCSFFFLSQTFPTTCTLQCTYDLFDLWVFIQQEESKSFLFSPCQEFAIEGHLLWHQYLNLLSLQKLAIYLLWEIFFYFLYSKNLLPKVKVWQTDF